MERLVGSLSKLFFGAAALMMGAFAFGLLVLSCYELLRAAYGHEPILEQILDSVGLITIAVAVFHVAKFLMEEELIGERQLRSIIESRRSLTMFVTIIIITLSIEGIVLVFETKLENINQLIYPTGLLAVAILAVVGLGLFQRLSAEGGSNRIGADGRRQPNANDQSISSAAREPK
jgi:hypothetical protein